MLYIFYVSKTVLVLLNNFSSQCCLAKVVIAFTKMKLCFEHSHVCCPVFWMLPSCTCMELSLYAFQVHGFACKHTQIHDYIIMKFQDINCRFILLFITKYETIEFITPWNKYFYYNQLLMNSVARWSVCYPESKSKHFLKHCWLTNFMEKMIMGMANLPLLSSLIPLTLIG